MRGQSYVCLFCRRAKRPPSTIHSVRQASWRQEPYVLPRLVIDLDAADSNLVRRATEEHNAVPDSQTQVRKIKSKAKSRGNRQKSDARPKAKQTPTVFRVSPPDLLAYALQGDSRPPSAGSHSRFEPILKWSMVHSSDSIETKIRHLTQAFDKNADSILREAGSGEEKFSNRVGISNQLQTKTDFSQLRHMVTMISSTPEGCRFLSQNGFAIRKGIQLCRRSMYTAGEGDGVSAPKVLSLLNNLQLNLASRDIGFGSRLSNTALYYASNACVLPAVKKHLDILQNNSYTTDSSTYRALYCLAKAFKYGHVRRGLHLGMESQQEREILRLITGWEDGEKPYTGEVRKFSFGSLTRQNDSHKFALCLYPRYIMILGELGLSDALWYEWTLEDSQKFPDIIRGKDHVGFRAQTFATAFLIANDSARALLVLKSVPEEGYHKLTAEQAKKLDSLTLMDSKSELNANPKFWLLSLMMEHYGHLQATPSDELLDLLKLTIKDFPRDPIASLKALDRLLLVNCPVNLNNVSDLVVELGVKDEKEGILLRSRKDSDSFRYWRATGPATMVGDM